MCVCVCVCSSSNSPPELSQLREQRSSPVNECDDVIRCQFTNGSAASYRVLRPTVRKRDVVLGADEWCGGCIRHQTSDAPTLHRAEIIQEEGLASLRSGQ